MKRTAMSIGVWVWTLVLVSTTGIQAQIAEDMIFHNGKIVTVDDPGFNSQVGTIAQAMHVQDGKIVQLGASAEILTLAGPDTKVMDLKGRMVLPGLILTHEHPWDWNAVEPTVVRRVLTDDIVLTRFLEGSPEENLKALPGVLAEAVEKARPGQWIYIVFTLGRKYEYGTRGNGPYGRGGMSPEAFNALDGTHITKAQLDALAPNNPVLLRDVFISLMVNQKALDESRKVFPQPDVNRIHALVFRGCGDERSLPKIGGADAPGSGVVGWLWDDHLLVQRL